MSLNLNMSPFHPQYKDRLARELFDRYYVTVYGKSLRLKPYNLTHADLEDCVIIAFTSVTVAALKQHRAEYLSKGGDSNLHGEGTAVAVSGSVTAIEFKPKTDYSIKSLMSSRTIGLLTVSTKNNMFSLSNKKIARARWDEIYLRRRDAPLKKDLLKLYSIPYVTGYLRERESRINFRIFELTYIEGLKLAEVVKEIQSEFAEAALSYGAISGRLDRLRDRMTQIPPDPSLDIYPDFDGTYEGDDDDDCDPDVD